MVKESSTISQYDTGQISDILLMEDFLGRFAQCGTPGVASTCQFSIVREGNGLLNIYISPLMANQGSLWRC